MANLMLNSTGRTFFQENVCSVFQYSDDCGTQVAGISESFGDVTNIYCESDTNTDEYVIKAQIRGSETSPTTTITSYLPADGVSQLLRLARKKCEFNMAIKYGECVNPTSFNDFDYGFLFEGVRITAYTTTDLTSRSPDSRSVIDLSFTVTIKKITELAKPEFAATAIDTTTANGALIALTAYADGGCGSVNCEDNCDILAIQYRSGTNYRFARRVDGTWYNSSILSATKSAGATEWIYTNGDFIYSGLSVSGNTLRVFRASYTDIEETTLAWDEIYTVTGSTTPRVYEYADKLYFGIANGANSTVGVLDLSTGGVTTMHDGLFGSDITSVAGYGSTIFIGTANGRLFTSNSGTLTGTNLDLGTGEDVDIVSIHDEDWLTVIGGSSTVYCTSDGGTTWTTAGSSPSGYFTTGVDPNNAWHNVLVHQTETNVYDTFDGGLSYVLNTTINSDTLSPQGIAYCGDKIYISAGTTDSVTGGIFENKR